MVVARLEGEAGDGDGGRVLSAQSLELGVGIGQVPPLRAVDDPHHLQTHITVSVCGVCGVCGVKGAYAEGLAVDLEVLPIAAVGGAAVDEARIDPSALPPPLGRPTPRHRSCAAHDKYLIFILYDL